MAPLVTIVLPVYNEGANIEEALTRIQREVRVAYEVFIVYDFEEDNTLPVAREFLKRTGAPIQLVKNRFGRGVLNAIKTGLAAAPTDYTVVTMADLSDPPAVINEMVDKARSEGFDIVCGSRYMKGGRHEGGPPVKSFLSKAAGLSLCWLARFPTHDVTNSFKLYAKRVLDEIKIESSGGFELGMEIVVKAWAQGFKVGEVPTGWADRSHGTSRFRFFSWMPRYLRWYFLALKTRFLRKPAVGPSTRLMKDR